MIPMSARAAPPILALHGNLGTPADWAPVQRAGLRAIDLWDHSDLDFTAFADALAGPLSEGLERPLLLGYSLGGRLALHALARHPQRWAGAVILAAHPGLCDPEERLARQRRDAAWAAAARHEDWERFLDRWNAQALFGPITPELHARQRALVSRREAIATAFAQWSLGRQADLRPALSAFPGPVDWVCGARDEKFAALAREMTHVFADCQLHLVPEGGHRLLESAPAAVTAALASVLSRLGGDDQDAKARGRAL